MRAAIIASILAISFSARAALYFTGSGPIPLGGVGFSFSTEQAMSGGGVISADGVILTLTFGNGIDLNGTIQGSLVLNGVGGPYYAGFTPTGTGLSQGIGSQEIYTVTFGSGADFQGVSPNGVWGLNLWDTTPATSGFENNLLSWNLQIDGASPVPEPVTNALALFGLVFVGVGAGRFYLRRRRQVV